MATVCTSDELAFEFCTQVVSARHAARGSEDGDRALAVSTPVPLRLRFLQPDSESDDELEADRMFLASVCSTNVSVKKSLVIYIMMPLGLWTKQVFLLCKK